MTTDPVTGGAEDVFRLALLQAEIRFLSGERGAKVHAHREWARRTVVASRALGAMGDEIRALDERITRLEAEAATLLDKLGAAHRRRDVGYGDAGRSFLSNFDFASAWAAIEAESARQIQAGERGA